MSKESKVKKVGFPFNKFKEYAKFLLENTTILNELTNNFFKRIKWSAIPLATAFKRLPAKQQKEILKKSIRHFLEHSLENAVSENSVIKLDEWKFNVLSALSEEEVKYNDILTLTHIGKQLLVDFIEKFTNNIARFRSIAAELDEFHIRFLEHTYNSFIEIHQEKQTQENHFISTLSDNSVDGILAFDKKLKVTAFNKVLEQWQGLKQKEIVGKNVMEIFSAYHDSNEENPLKKALQGEKIYISEKPFKRREGYFDANVVPLYDHKEQVTGGIIFIHDISRRKEAETAFLETKHLLQEITAAVLNVTYLRDFASKQDVFVYKDALFLLGYSPEEAKSVDRARLEGLVHPDDSAALEKYTTKMLELREGEVSVLHTRIKHKDGQWRWLSTKSKIFNYDANEKPLQILMVFEDVSEIIENQQLVYKQNKELLTTLAKLQFTEKQLREINEELEHRVKVRTNKLAEREREVKKKAVLLRMITDATPALISYIKSDYTYGFVNKRYEHIFRKKRKKIIGATVKDIIGEKAFHSSLPFLQLALKGELVETEILQDYGKAGKKWVKAHFVPHKVKGNIAGTFVLVEDISNFKKIQAEQEGLLAQLKKVNSEKEKALKQLEKKNQELERTNIDLDNFIYTASHDLRSPISNMQGLMALLRNTILEKFNSEEIQLFELVENSIQRLQKILVDLVEVTKIQNNLDEAVEEPIRFGKIVGDVKKDIFSLIQEESALIKEDYQLEEISYKKGSLRSIIYNLLSNAIKYRHPKRPLEITLKTYMESSYSILSVRDNGLGLNPHQQNQLFTLFKRMHPKVEGTGVGLFMIKRIVENSGGKIEVKSEEGKGSIFKVYLKR